MCFAAGRSLRCNGSLYCVAQRRELQRELQEKIDKHGILNSFEDSFSCSLRLRLDKWLEFAAAEGCTVGFPDIQQNVEFGTKDNLHRPLRPWVPTLMRSSLLYSLSAGRVAKHVFGHRSPPFPMSFSTIFITTIIIIPPFTTSSFQSPSQS